MDKLWESAIPVLFTFITGGIFGGLLKYWFDYKGMVFKQLWNKRYETYKKMFALTGFLPLYPLKEEVRYKDLSQHSHQMNAWFFNDGGLLLSTTTRNKFYEVHEEIFDILKQKTDPEKIIDKEEYKNLINLFSQLRRAMTDDLKSRGRL